MGGRLWRSTEVTLGSQVADRISVLPNMKGIVASFDCVQPQLEPIKLPSGSIERQQEPIRTQQLNTKSPRTQAPIEQQEEPIKTKQLKTKSPRVQAPIEQQQEPIQTQQLNTKSPRVQVPIEQQQEPIQTQQLNQNSRVQVPVRVWTSEGVTDGGFFATLLFPEENEIAGKNLNARCPEKPTSSPPQMRELSHDKPALLDPSAHAESRERPVPHQDAER
jgi:hypothetical protein